MMDVDAASLKEIEVRPLEYWNVDGVPGLIASLGWLLWGGSFGVFCTSLVPSCS